MGGGVWTADLEGGELGVHPGCSRIVGSDDGLAEVVPVPVEVEVAVPA